MDEGVEGWKRGWKEEKNILHRPPVQTGVCFLSFGASLGIFWSKFGPRVWKQHPNEGRRNSSSDFQVSSAAKSRITQWGKFEQAASLHLRSSMTLTMISNDDKCSVKELQAPESLSHSIKDGIKWRLSLMCRSCRRRRWRTLDEESFYKCAGETCFRCPSTDPHHGLEFWFSTCLETQKL